MNAPTSSRRQLARPRLACDVCVQLIAAVAAIRAVGIADMVWDAEAQPRGPREIVERPLRTPADPTSSRGSLRRSGGVATPAFAGLCGFDFQPDPRVMVRADDAPHAAEGVDDLEPPAAAGVEIGGAGARPP